MCSVRIPGAALALAAVVSSAACDGSPSASTSPSAVPADAVTTENFSATVPVGGSVFYSFSIAQWGNVAVTLTGVSGGELPEQPALALAVGQPSGTGCNVAATTTATPGEAPQVTGAWGPGIFCVKVADPGTLVAPVHFSAAVAHP